MRFKSFSHGIAKSRSGKPAISLQTLINRAKVSGFLEVIKEAVSDEEALSAANRLTSSQGQRARRYGTGAAIGAVTAPAVTLAGNLAEAMGKPGRAAGLRAAWKVTTARPQIMKDIAKGTVTGGGVQAIREGVQAGQDRRTAQAYLRERGHAV